jgi:hypothetical protein
MDRYKPETDRLTFLQGRDGLAGAIDFARRTMVIYRRVVVSKDRSKEDRRTFVESYLAFKRFLRDNT